MTINKEIKGAYLHSRSRIKAALLIAYECRHPTYESIVIMHPEKGDAEVAARTKSELFLRRRRRE